jgi:hypothetical protein
MKIRILSIISIGITMGFLLGMAVIGMLRAFIDGKNPGLELAFAVMVTIMGGWLIYYVVRTVR